MLRPKIDVGIKDLSVSETESFLNDNIISFEEIYKNYGVGIVDVVNSTKIISKLSQEKACLYYSVFLNTIGYIAQSHGAKVVKNIGDGILFYFPKNSTKSLECALVCATKMLEASEMINKIFQKRKMPKIQYRISLDYGPLMIAKYMTSSCKDIFGSTVNLCAKLNRIAKPNSLVIGSDMYQIVKKSRKYRFNEVDELQSALKQDYPVYSAEKV
jgi:class 3 adenylate cyclase